MAKQQAEDAPEPEIEVPDPDQGWKALGLVNDWIKHAESKTGVALALAGATGGTLYNLVKGLHHPGCVLRLAAVLCGAGVIAAGGCAAMALLPRMRLDRKREDPTNLLFFSHIARAYPKDSPTYVDVLCSLTSKPDELTRHIAHQVHANATVAHRKFIWANRAILALIVALAALGVVASIAGSR